MIIFLLVISIFLFLIAASFKMSWGIYLKSFCRSYNVEERAVMLTFDDGPHPIYTPMVLDTLLKRGVKALFFLIGERALEHPEIVKRMVNEGHRVGIHSLRHTPEFTIAPRVTIMRDLEATKKILEELTGEKVDLFRAPFGVTNPSIAGAVRKLNLRSVGWSVRSFDTAHGRSIDRVYKRVVRRVKSGDIVLLHDRLATSSILLERIIDFFEENSYEAKLFREIL